jgi:hypothetical protein
LKVAIKEYLLHPFRHSRLSSVYETKKEKAADAGTQAGRTAGMMNKR